MPKIRDNLRLDKTTWAFINPPVGKFTVKFNLGWMGAIEGKWIFKICILAKLTTNKLALHLKQYKTKHGPVYPMTENLSEGFACSTCTCLSEVARRKFPPWSNLWSHETRDSHGHTSLSSSMMSFRHFLNTILTHLNKFVQSCACTHTFKHTMKIKGGWNPVSVEQRTDTYTR